MYCGKIRNTLRSVQHHYRKHLLATVLRRMAETMGKKKGGGPAG